MRTSQPDRIIERAVELWCRKLHNPVFDNGDDTPQGFLSEGLAAMVIENDKEKMPDREAQIERFRKALVLNLKAIRDRDDYFPLWLDVDYGPCKELAEAAETAGIPHSQFSCKSSVSMLDDCVSTSFGYGAERVNHHPMPDGRWLITTLTRSDISKVIDDAMDGNHLGLMIEPTKKTA